MKELSTEQKAQKYEEAIKVIRNCKTDKYGCVIGIKPSDIFLELKESEDEKISKALIHFINEQDGFLTAINGINVKDIIAWLEKRGDQTSLQTNEHIWLHLVADVLTWKDGIGQYLDDPRVQEIAKKLRNEYTQKLYKPSVLSNSSNTGKIEQKSTDNVKQKFKVGDWITFYEGEPFKILKIEAEQNGILNYLLLSQNGHDSYYNKKYVDENARLWTIQNAKNGDVLASDNGVIILVKESRDSHWGYRLSYHCAVLYDGKFESREFYVDPAKFLPATKEQRELLFQKMKEAEYTFDFEKKEVKKVYEEVNAEDYGIDALYHAQRILEKTLGKVDGYQSDDGILDHKAAITTIKKLYKQKTSKWSKEDEKEFKQLLNTLHANGYESFDIWLKSLKERVQLQEWSEEDEKIYQSIMDDTVQENQLNDKQINWLENIKYRNFA